MEWLFIVGLGVVALLQHNRINRLARELEALQRPAAPQPAATRAGPVKATVAKPDAASAPALSDEERLAAARAALEAARQGRPPPATPAPVALKARPVAAAPHRPARPPGETGRAISAWLAENGLAWLGGGALALGGLLLVVYAAQRGVFTPPLRIAAALALGAAMIAAGEWIRRQDHAPGGRHLLAAGAAAGAGATTIYGAIWAAQALYHLIPLPVAAALIAVGSLALLAYAVLHGQALGLLAIIGGFLAPAITGPRDWSPLALQIYLGVLVVTGFAAAARQGWRQAGIVTLVGAAFWALIAWERPNAVEAGLLMLGPAVAAALAVEWRRRARGEEAAADLKLLPTIALAAAAALALRGWLAASLAPEDVAPLATAVISAALLALGAALVWRRLAPPVAFLAPVLAVLLGAPTAVYGLNGDWAMIAARLTFVLAGLTAAAGLAAGLTREGRERTLLLAAGGLGAALTATLAWPSFNALPFERHWLAPGLVALLLAAGAAVAARRSPDAAKDSGLGLCIAGGAELLFLTVYGAFDPFWAPVGQGAAALVLAALALRLPWRGLAPAAAAGGIVAFASLLRPDVVREALLPATQPALLALMLAAAAGLIFTAGRLTRRGADKTNEAEALETGALLIALFGGFLMIHRALAGGEAQGLGPLMAASLRSLLLLAAALLLAWRARADDGLLARLRLPILLVGGLAHATVCQALVLNPWWGLGEAPLGPPLVDTLTLAYLAPALILAAIAWRGMPGDRAWTRAAAVAAFGFGWLWALMAIRDAFHPANLDGPAGRAEWAAYALLALATALALSELRKRAKEGSRLVWLATAAQPVAWAALAVSALIFWLVASPWWGPMRELLAPATSAALLFALYAVGAAAGLALARRADLAGWGMLARAALAAAVIDLFVLITLLVRYAFRGEAMAVRIAEARVETWAFSAVWALFGLAVLVIGAARRSLTLRWLGLALLIGTVLKVLIFDTARLDGVIRAASFLAVGALLIVGAVAARRLNAGAFFTPRKAAPETPA